MASPKEKSLESTPTWAVAVFCFILVAISLVIEHLIDYTEKWLKKKRKIPLSEALGKIKSELMLLGFISLLLTVTQDRVSDICVPKSVGNSWHPCSNDTLKPKKYTDTCAAKGKAQLVSSYGLHQLHIFIFVLALTHVLYCIATYALGKLKMRTWRIWEDETKTNEYQLYNDPERFRFARDTSFGRRHLHSWSNSPLIWIECFFRQFYPSVAKVDYLTLRHGFIAEHLPPQMHSSFDFQIYIERALEEDFKVIVGIRPVLWLCAVLFLLTNTNGWYSHLWLPFIPLAILLLVGTKLHVIITKMGIRILEKGGVVMGATPVVHPSDDLFWFRRPEFMLFLIHFVLFENAFQIAFFAWSWFKFGYPSCFHENIEDLLIRIVMGIFIQILCTYATLPLYALVTQMGSKMKPIIFGDEVATGLQEWQNMAKKNVKEGRRSANISPVSSRPASPLRGTETSVIQIDRGDENPSTIELASKSQQEGNSNSKDFSFARDSSTASK